MSEEKLCTGCDTTKPVTDYRMRSTGLPMTRCRECENMAARKAYAKNPGIKEGRKRRYDATVGASKTGGKCPSTVEETMKGR